MFVLQFLQVPLLFIRGHVGTIDLFQGLVQFVFRFFQGTGHCGHCCLFLFDLVVVGLFVSGDQGLVLLVGRVATVLQHPHLCRCCVQLHLQLIVLVDDGIFFLGTGGDLQL